MAGAPPPNAPPESVLLQQFTGLKNTVSSERLGPGELEIALNIDLDDVGQPRRRRGRTLVKSGRWHSLYTTPEGRTYGVRDARLVQIFPNYSVLDLGLVCGEDLLSWETVATTVYLTSDFVSAKIHPDDSVTLWGADAGENRWLSPVVRPSETLPQIRGKIIGKPPLASALAYFNGRIYLAHGNTLWATELYLYDYVDKTKNFVQFESEITCIASVTDGIYVGTKTGMWFMTGPFAKMQRILVAPYAVLARSMVKTNTDGLPNQKTVSHNAVLCMTDLGLCVGYDAGVFSILTDDKMWFPKAESVAAMVRRQDGIQQYVGVADSGGSPASNARIGDYVEAEIRRFQGA